MILDDLVSATKKRVAKEKLAVPVTTLQEQIRHQSVTNPAAVYQLFRQPGLHVIAEVKQASPSKGVIVADLPYQKIAQKYDQAGVTAISVLTEPDYFLGNLTYLAEIAGQVDRPILRKDFIIDPYMVYQAKAAGARIILLIVAILSATELTTYLALAEKLGLAVLVEVHDEQEIDQALTAGAKMIGVNNRNLKDFSISFENSLRLRQHVPADLIFIAESGVKSPADFHRLETFGVNGVLIGEALMKAADPKAFLQEGLAVTDDEN